MSFIVIIIVETILLILIKLIYSINLKEIKKIGNNIELDEEVSRYPSNIDICKEILKKIENENVKIQEDESANNCLYMVISNKILIANMRNSFTRIQTIAHECIHSKQNRRILMFHYLFANFYNICFVILVILGLLNKIDKEIIIITIFIILGFVFYFVRSYLENDAMIRARYTAKEYIEEQNISSKEKIKQIIMEYDKLNDIGIRYTNYNLFFNIFLKVIILSIIMMF